MHFKKNLCDCFALSEEVKSIYNYIRLNYMPNIPGVNLWFVKIVNKLLASLCFYFEEIQTSHISCHMCLTSLFEYMIQILIHLTLLDFNPISCISSWCKCIVSLHGVSAWCQCMVSVHGVSAWCQCMVSDHGVSTHFQIMVLMHCIVEQRPLFVLFPNSLLLLYLSQ